MEDHGPGGGPREGAAPVHQSRPARIPRVGAFLLFLGALLVALSFAIQAVQYYQLVYGTPPSNFDQYELTDASQATLAGLGLILVGVGWVLDQAAIEQRMSRPSPANWGGGRAVFFALFIAGALCAAVGEFWYATLAFAAYAELNFTVWEGTLPTFEALLATGVLLMAVGWLARHVRILSSIETRIP